MTDRTAARAIAFAWLVSGTLDIASALIYYPLTTAATPVRILQGIASGVLGPRAFAGGTETAALGLALHYLIAFIWTVLFFAACSGIPALARSPFAAGMVYGIVVWCVMNLVVLPLSRVHRGPLTPGAAIVAALFLMFCIGLPDAFIIGRYVLGRQDQVTAGTAR